MKVITKYNIGDVVLFDGNKNGEIVSFEIGVTKCLIHIIYRIRQMDDPSMGLTLRYESEIEDVTK